MSTTSSTGASTESGFDLDLAEIQRLEQEHQVSLYAKREIALVRGEGAYLYDSEGRKYLDAMSNYGIAILGHADPEFAAAISDQAHTLTTGHQSFYNDVRAALLQELTTIAPSGLSRFFLTNSGAESIEAGLKFARAATGRSKIVAAKRGYHGRTIGALAATADQKYRGPFEPFGFEVTHVAFDDASALEQAVDGETAAVILEPIQGEAGVYPASEDFLRTAREITSRHGALLIADEVQSGFRAGAPFAISRSGVVPDLLCTAKGLGNGFPIGLTMTTEGINAALPSGTHGTTFGGNPLAARAALTTLTILRERDLYSRSADVGNHLIEQLTALSHPKVRQVRGRGLMVGIELKERITPTLRGLQEAGVLALPASATTLRLLPPLIWERAQVDEFIQAFRQVLG
jgi:acetylornithine/LysW-gamma-L-lysine aminotransferase